MVRNLFPCLYTHAHALKPKLQGFYFLWGRWGSPLAHHFFLDSSQDTQTTIRSGSIRGLGYKSCILPTTCRARRMATGTRHLLLLRLSHSALVVSALQADKADTFFIRLQLHSGKMLPRLGMGCPPQTQPWEPERPVQGAAGLQLPWPCGASVGTDGWYSSVPQPRSSVTSPAVPPRSSAASLCARSPLAQL